MALCAEVGNGGGHSVFESGRGSISILNESPQGIVLQENHYFRKPLRVKEFRAKFNLLALTSNPHIMDEIK